VNYRHAFHAGNFADLVKHAALLALLRRLLADPAPLTVVDTHAGAGLYDLSDETQARSKEADAGIRRLMGADAVPTPLAPLAEAVRRINRAGGVELYPGSPALILGALRPGDRYIACELRPEERDRLAGVLEGARGGAEAEARLGDGFAAAPAVARSGPGRLFVLIDPPFERADDYVRIAETVQAVMRASPRVVHLIWLPLKDLETLDGFVRRLEAIEPAPPVLISETRIRPLTDPMKMNGCALVAIGAPPGFEDDLSAVSEAVVSTLGEAGSASKLWRTGR
jgi:23S rRNA (adenine2030-N6)-methyltransferase